MTSSKKLRKSFTILKILLKINKKLRNSTTNAKPYRGGSAANTDRSQKSNFFFRCFYFDIGLCIKDNIRGTIQNS
jgi:hypothetical protein